MVVDEPMLKNYVGSMRVKIKQYQRAIDNTSKLLGIFNDISLDADGAVKTNRYTLQPFTQAERDAIYDGCLTEVNAALQAYLAPTTSE